MLQHREPVEEQLINRLRRVRQEDGEDAAHGSAYGRLQLPWI